MHVHQESRCELYQSDHFQHKQCATWMAKPVVRHGPNITAVMKGCCQGHLQRKLLVPPVYAQPTVTTPLRCSPFVVAMQRHVDHWAQQKVTQKKKRKLVEPCCGGGGGGAEVRRSPVLKHVVLLQLSRKSVVSSCEDSSRTEGPVMVLGMVSRVLRQRLEGTTLSHWFLTSSTKRWRRIRRIMKYRQNLIGGTF